MLPEKAVFDTEEVVFSPAQLRAARALLGWPRKRLAKVSGIAEITIKGFESGKSDPRLSTLTALRGALVKAGVTFIDESDELGPGVAFRKTPVRR